MAVEPAEIGRSYEHFCSYNDAKQFRHKLTIALNGAAKNFREGKVLNNLYSIEEEGLHTGIYILSDNEGDSIKINTNNFDRFICG